MQIKEILRNINEELGECIERLREDQLCRLEQAIQDKNRIFVAGAGRSGMMIRGLAMRLMHMGYTAYVVGETVTPAISSGDLLIIASGSGATGSMEVMARKCKTIGASLALITTKPDSAIGRLADIVVHVDTVTCKSQPGEETRTSAQPGANTFEQTVLLIGDALITGLVRGQSVEESNRVLMARHANLE